MRLDINSLWVVVGRKNTSKEKQLMVIMQMEVLVH